MLRHSIHQTFLGVSWMLFLIVPIIYISKIGIGHILSFAKFHSVLILQSAISSYAHIFYIRHRSAVS